jgi:hypothetical protein
MDYLLSQSIIHAQRSQRFWQWPTRTTPTTDVSVGRVLVYLHTDGGILKV